MVRQVKSMSNQIKINKLHECQPLTKTMCQLGFRCGQQSPQPATTASVFNSKAIRSRQLYIILSVSTNLK